MSEGIPGINYEWGLLYQELRSIHLWQKYQTLILGALVGALGVNIILPGVG